jgi:hypothetical protein
MQQEDYMSVKNIGVAPIGMVARYSWTYVTRRGEERDIECGKPLVCLGVTEMGELVGYVLSYDDIHIIPAHDYCFPPGHVKDFQWLGYDLSNEEQ